MRTEHEHERIILDSQYKPDGVGDGTVFTDMAFKAADQDRVGVTGRHVLCKVPHTKGNRIRSEVVTAVDGCTSILVSDISGEKHVVALIRK